MPAERLAASGEAVLEQLVPMAVGVLMHRYSLSRQESLQRLEKLAETEGRSVAEAAQRLIEAVELLAMPGR
jgi:response regulator NasT